MGSAKNLKHNGRRIPIIPTRHFHVHLDGPLAVVTLDRPPANALATDVLDELMHLADGLGADPAVRAVAFCSANGKIFASGADLQNLRPAGDSLSPDSAVRATIVHFQAAFNRLELLPKPTVACIGGHALGGGCEFALACDLRVMVDDGRATIGLPEVRLGIIPGAGGTQRLTRVVGRSRAMELILRARRLQAPEALAIGLVNAIFPPAEFPAGALAYARELAEGPTVALAAAKRAVQAAGGPMELGLALEVDGSVASLLSADAQEGIQAFFQKRRPEFRGR